MQLQPVYETGKGPRFEGSSDASSRGQDVGSNEASARDAELNDILKRINPEVAATFTPAQRRVLRSLLATRGATRHMLDMRHTLPVFGKRYYLAIFFGRERRFANLTRDLAMKDLVCRYLVYLGLALTLLVPFYGLASLLRG